MCQAAPNPELRALFALQGMCGLRVSEARAIRPHHFNLDEMILRVPGKGNKERYVPISKKAWHFIEPAFRTAQQGEPLINYTDRGARAAVTGMGKKLGLKRSIASHDLRATVATAMYDGSKNIRAVQEFLGHASVKTTEIYTHIGMNTMREALEF